MADPDKSAMLVERRYRIGTKSPEFPHGSWLSFLAKLKAGAQDCQTYFDDKAHTTQAISVLAATLGEGTAEQDGTVKKGC